MGDEGIFLCYSTRRKAYKFLNKGTDTMIESENLRIDEFENKNDAERKKGLEDYKRFFYVQEGGI